MLIPNFSAFWSPDKDPTYKAQAADDDAKVPHRLTPEQRRESTRDAGILFNVEKYQRLGKTRAEAMELVSRNLLQSGHFKLDEARNRVSKLIKGDLSLNPPKQALGSPQQATLPSFAQSFLTPTPEGADASIKAQAAAFVARRAQPQSAFNPRDLSGFQGIPNWVPPSSTPITSGRSMGPSTPISAYAKPAGFSPVIVRGLQ